MPRAVINVHSFLQDFNPTKFTVYASTLIFTILLSLRLDGRISLSYWLVFLPLWIWKGIAILGALVGIVIWLRKPEYRASNSSYVHFKSMLISVGLQILLLTTEMLVCDKLETRRHTWTLTFMPLLFVSLLCISVCLWSIRNGRGFELELFAAVNILQISLIALKLDRFISWSWIVVFVPSWIMLCFALVIILYAMIFAAVVLRSPDIGSEQRRASIQSASSLSFVYVPMLFFIIILTSKLDSPPSVPTPGYFFTFIPLFITLLILIRLSFGSKTGSLWWFGMRSDFCSFLLRVCPCLKEYGNTSFVVAGRQGDTVADERPSSRDSGSNTPNSYQAAPESQRQEPAELGAVPASNPTDSTKQLLRSLKQVLMRNKSPDDVERGDQLKPVACKLNIDAPD